MPPTVSVIIPACNRAGMIAQSHRDRVPSSPAVPGNEFSSEPQNPGSFSLSQP